MPVSGSLVIKEQKYTPTACKKSLGGFSPAKAKLTAAKNMVQTSVRNSEDANSAILMSRRLSSAGDNLTGLVGIKELD